MKLSDEIVADLPRLARIGYLLRHMAGIFLQTYNNEDPSPAIEACNAFHESNTLYRISQAATRF